MLNWCIRILKYMQYEVFLFDIISAIYDLAVETTYCRTVGDDPPIRKFPTKMS